MTLLRRLAAALIAAGALSLSMSLTADEGRALAGSAAQDQQDENPQLMTRVYSLRPLVAEARQSAIAAGMVMHTRDILVLPPGQAAGLGGLTVADGGEPSDRTDEVIKHVIEIITSTVAPDTWQENGGPIGSITYLPINSRLIITHTAEVHDRVAQLINELQDRQVVSVRAKLVRLPESQVEQSTRLVDGVAVWQGETADLPILAQVRFSGFDGQPQHAASGRSQGYFQSVQPIVAANAVAYQPIAEEMQTGLILQATPILTVDARSATVEINAQYLLLDDHQPAAGYWQLAPDAAGTERLLTLRAMLDPTTQHLDLAPRTPPATQPATGEAGAWVALRPQLAMTGRYEPAVLPDRLSVHRRLLDTSLRVPVGQWVLVGTLGASDDGEPTQQEPLHLLIRIDAGGGD